MENLFEIQYQKKFPFVKVSKQNLFSIFFIALLTGIGAFIYETLLDYVMVGMLYDRGFLIGPFLPIYFFVILFGLLYIKTPKRNVKNFFLSALVIGGGITLLEFIVGNIFELLFKVQLWTYDGFMPLSYKYISLTVFLVWGILGAAFLFFIIPLLRKLSLKIPEKAHLPIFMTFLLIFLVDFTTTLVLIGLNHWTYKELYQVAASTELTLFMLGFAAGLAVAIILGRFMYKSFFKYRKIGVAIFAFSLVPLVFSCVDQIQRVNTPFLIFMAKMGFIIAAFYIYFILALPFVFLIRFIIYRSTKKEIYHSKKARSVALYLSMICSFSMLGYGGYALKNPSITHLNVGSNDHLPFKIVAVSDVHYGTTGAKVDLDKMAKRLNALEPDLIFLLGDIIDNHIENINQEKFITAMNALEATYGVYAIPGNHEYNYNTHTEIMDLYDKTNVHLLIDDVAVIDNRLLVVGRDDFTWTSRASLSSLTRYYKDLPIIVLDHQPQDYKEAEEVGAVLQLSGHTHNGQLFPANWIVNLFYHFVYHSSHSNGRYTHDNFTLYVTRGYGAWGFPLRTTGRSEILDIRLFASEKGEK